MGSFRVGLSRRSVVSLSRFAALVGGSARITCSYFGFFYLGGACSGLCPFFGFCSLLSASFSSLWFQLVLSLPAFFSFHFCLQSLLPADCHLLLPSLRRILSIIRATFELM
uniref:Transmembrane protein n=1 Tax=Salix viminalis TaxID=40686 RepID=A0A6N2M858_SALVM